MQKEKEQYRSNFDRWRVPGARGAGTIFAKDRRVVDPAEDSVKQYFPEDLVPLSRHAVVRKMGGSILREMLIQRLYQYLAFTKMLELEAVTPVLTDLALGRIENVMLPRGMTRDALKMAVDETHHAEFSEDIKDQVREVSGVAEIEMRRPRFLQRLDELVESVPASKQRLARMYFTVVSETLISAILADIPEDESVNTAVRNMVADHAEDEARHSAYFHKLLRIVWPQMSVDDREVIGPLLPEFILAFLEPDYDALNETLHALGLNRSGIQLVLSETMTARDVLRDARQASRRTLNSFQSVGVFDDAWTLDAFQARGLWN